MPAIDAVLSIGPNCRAAHQLDRVFGEVRAKSIFDWQMTPLATIHAYLDNDFRGLFERTDLEVRKGIVWNGRFNTSHMHEFPRGLLPEDLDRHYPDAHARHVHLCKRTRAAFHSRRRLLIVYSAPATPDEIDGLRAHLRTYAPKQRFHLIGETADCADGSEWPAVDAWRGSTAAWDRLLAPYRISLLRKLSLHLKRHGKTRKAAAERKR